MRDMVEGMAGEQPDVSQSPELPNATRAGSRVPIESLPAHSFPGQVVEKRQKRQSHRGAGYDAYEEDRVRRVYRGRTVAMLRQYVRYSMETGRLPSLLGREFFRSKVTSYTMVTFEDRVIFAHDMEKCLDRLDEFSRQIIARHILQEYDQAETGRLLHCTERTVRSYIPMALDLLSSILVEVGLLDPVDSSSQKCCQGGVKDEFLVSDCEEGRNKF